MHQRKWLLALLLAALLAPVPLRAAERENPLSGLVEVGAAGVDIQDDKSRVNEYSVIRPDDGAEAYGKIDLRGAADGVAVDARVDYFGSRDQKYDAGLDLKRVLRLETNYGTFQHWLDHDQMLYLDAAVPPPPAGVPAGTPGVPLSPDSVPSFIIPGSYDPINHTVTTGGNAPGSQQIGRASLFGEDLTPGEDFSIIYREWENRADLTVPQFPNVTFHAGYRLQEREGKEQSIGMSKCTSCHITGQGKEIDEQTRDFSAGFTGRFGLLTVDYTFTDREFRERGDDPTRRYDPALSPGAAYSQAFGTFDNRILYDYDQPAVEALRYDVTPDSDKESHLVKAKVDLPHSTSVLASYVNTEVESKKRSEAGIFALSDDRLETGYDAYALKLSTRLGKRLTLSLRARLEEVDNDSVDIAYFPNALGAPPNLGGSVDPASLLRTRESVLDRDVATVGLDGLYRLARYTTLRLGYEYKEVDRDDEVFGKTETHTVKASFKARPAKNLTTRLSYTYQDITNPFQHEGAAGFIDPATGLPYASNADPRIGTGELYGTAFYDLRQTDMSNLPDEVHEAKLSATWAPAANFSATVSYRARFEENDLERSTWKQQTHNPGLSLWYAPAEKLNLTFAYNYLGQRAEAKFCQGWYDG